MQSLVKDQMEKKLEIMDKGREMIEVTDYWSFADNMSWLSLTLYSTIIKEDDIHGRCLEILEDTK